MSNDGGVKQFAQGEQMTVKEYIEKLKLLPQDAPIVAWHGTTAGAGVFDFPTCEPYALECADNEGEIGDELAEAILAKNITTMVVIN